MSHTPSSDPDDEPTEDFIITPHGMGQMQPSTFPKFDIALSDDITPEERLAAHERYMEARCGKATGGVYNAMIHRTVDGSDPLVEEPGP
jgi:hypothetical protein